MLVVGCLMFFDAGRVPGDLGDGRFNQYVLEHGFRWLTGAAPSFWDAPFFYPARNVIAYSDSHLGTLPIYALLRLLSLDREAAFNAWLVTCCVLNFISAAWVLRKLGLPVVAVAAGAFVFAFALPVTAKLGHAQVIPRFFIPLAFYAAMQLLETKAPRYWYALLVLGIAQMYVSIYTGYFLSICVGTLMLAWFFCGRGAPGWRMLPRPTRPSLRLVVISFALTSMLVPLALPYYEVSRIIGTRTWEEISSMLPRVGSFFWAPHSITWQWLLPGAASFPMPNEHVMFVGVLPMLAVVWAAAVRNSTVPLRGLDGPRWIKALVLGLALTVLVTLFAGEFTFYRILTFMPGVGGIRAVTRIILVMLFPVSILVAVAVARMTFWVQTVGYRTGAQWFLGFMLLVACAVDQRAATISFDAVLAKKLIMPYKQEMLRAGKPVYWMQPVNIKAPFWMTQLSSMLAAQELGIVTINGYSGNSPPGYPMGMYLPAPGGCAHLQQWYAGNAFVIDPAQVASNSPCPTASASPLPLLERGFHGWEGVLGAHSWASGRDAVLLVSTNEKSTVTGAVLEFELVTLVPRSVRIGIAGSSVPIQTHELTPGRSVPVRVFLALGKQGARVVLRTDQEAALPGNGDPRIISFGIQRVKLTPER